MGRDVDFRDQGVANFFEGLAGGANKVGLRAPAAVAADFDIELLAALPGSIQALTIDATGQMGTTAVGAGDLDDAYDFPTPGAGRAITGDAGAVEITVPAASGNAALSLIQADNFTALLISKTGVGAGSPVSITDAGTGITLDIVKTGPSGSPLSISGGGGTLVWTGNLLDVQGDNTSGALSVTSLDVGTNPVIKTFQFGAGVALHVDNSGNAFPAVVRLESGAGVTDALLEFVQNSVKRWELGYDQSAAAFVLGRLDFTNPAMSVDDTTGVVNFLQALDQDAVVITQAGDALGLNILKTGVGPGVALGVTNSGTGNALDVTQNGIGGLCLALRQNTATEVVEVLKVGGGANVNTTIKTIGGTGFGLFVDHQVNSGALLIVSLATSNPLLILSALSANARGDIAFGITRTAAPSAPSNGDLWYDGTLERLEIRSGGVNFTAASRYVASSFPGNASIVAGVATAGTGNISFLAEGGPGLDDLDTLNTTPAAQNRDEVTIKAGTGETITVKHNIGNIHLDGAADKVLVNGNHFKLKFNGTDWEQLTTMMVLL